MRLRFERAWLLICYFWGGDTQWEQTRPRERFFILMWWWWYYWMRLFKRIGTRQLVLKSKRCNNLCQLLARMAGQTNESQSKFLQNRSRLKWKEQWIRQVWTADIEHLQVNRKKCCKLSLNFLWFIYFDWKEKQFKVQLFFRNSSLLLFIHKWVLDPVYFHSNKLHNNKRGLAERR